MKKKLLTAMFCLLMTSSIAKSIAVDENFGFEKVMLMRNDIQNRLDLSADQQVKRSHINEKYHPQFDKKFAEIGQKINEIGILANSKNCTKDKVDALVDDFKVSENELFEINQNYEKEIRSILTPKQRIKYSVLRFNNKQKLKKELRNEINNMKQSAKDTKKE